MAATGILGADNVVFYHPLDNSNKLEHTKSQAWTGSAGFVSGKISGATSAIAGDSFSFPVAGKQFEGDGGFGRSIVKLDSTRFFLLYPDFPAEGSGHYVRVVTVVGTDITLGPRVKFFTPRQSARFGYASLLDTDKVIGVNGAPSPSAWVFTISGTIITVGPTATFSSGNSIQMGVAGLSPTKAIIVFSQTSVTGINVIGVTISGTDITFGAELNLVATAISVGVGIVKVDATRAVVAYRDPADSNAKSAVITMSGTTVVAGVTALPGFATPTPARGLGLLMLDASRVAMSATRSDNNGVIVIGTVTGTTIVWDTPVITSLGTAAKTLTLLETDKLALAGQGGSFTRVQVVTVSGTTPTVGALSETPLTIGSSIGEPVIVAIDSSTVLLADHSGTAGGRTLLIVGQLGTESSLDGDASYPAATGNDRLVVAMWANKVGAGTSTFTVKRDFTVVLDATSISLGPATAVWSSAAVATLVGTTMAGGVHFLVLDFENTGGGNWTLSTSLDGGEFIPQGTQTSGTRTVAPAALVPGLSLIPNGSAGQWVDELVMWSGNKTTFAQFTTQELANLQDLADVFGATMNQFEQNFGAPLCWQATANMPDGSVWRDSGSGPCPPVIRVPKGADDIVVTDDGRMASPRVIEG